MSTSPAASMDEQVISGLGLVKHFGSTRALAGFDFHLSRGEVHGFLGPNGAGKSTTIRAILGQLRLDAGTLTVFGLDPRRDGVAVRSRLAYVPGDTSLWPQLTGGECIDLLGRFGGRQDKVRRNELVERFQLDPTKRARSYSKGNRQKVSLISALSADVELLVLDEPTSGLDPLMEAEFQQAIREAVASGQTVLLSSHILDEVEALCQRVTIIRAGRSISTGTLDELRANTRSTIDVVTAQEIARTSLTAGCEVVSETHPQGVRTVLTVAPDALAQAVHVIAHHDPITLTVRPPSLDELFLEHYQDGAGERA